MDFVFDLLQGIGIAAAIGIRPMLPVLLAGALATQDLGLDLDGTDFAFLESWPFLLAAVLVTAALVYAGRNRPVEPRPLVRPFVPNRVAVGPDPRVAGNEVRVVATDDFALPR